MVRVAALKQKLKAGNQDLSIDGKTVAQQLSAVRAPVGGLMKEILRLLPQAAACRTWRATASAS
jgi:polyphosphate kinase